MEGDVGGIGELRGDVGVLGAIRLRTGDGGERGVSSEWLGFSMFPELFPGCGVGDEIGRVRLRECIVDHSISASSLSESSESEDFAGSAWFAASPIRICAKFVSCTALQR